MIVIDSSALVKVLTEKSPSGDMVRDRLAGESLCAPALLDAEVLSALRGLVLGRKLAKDRAETALDLLRRMPLERVPLTPLLDRAWRLRDNYSAYDAMYVTLAESLDCPLVTGDKRMSNGAGAACRIEVFS